MAIMSTKSKISGNKYASKMSSPQSAVRGPAQSRSSALPGDNKPQPKHRTDGKINPGAYLCTQPTNTGAHAGGNVKLDASYSFSVIHQNGAWLKVRVYMPDAGDGRIGYVRRMDTDLVVSRDRVDSAQTHGNNNGVLGHADTNAAEIARYNSNETFYDNLMRATSAVETGGSYETTGDINDGAGLSVGGFQYTEKYSLATLVRQYRDMGGTVEFGDDNIRLLDRAIHNDEPLSLDKRSEIQGLLQKAFDTDYDRYIAAQKLTWLVNYFKPCTELMYSYGLRPTGCIETIPATYVYSGEKLLDERISILIYDHENSGHGNNQALMRLLAGKFPSGKKNGKHDCIDQSKLTLENVAQTVQEQFKQCDNYSRYKDGWNNRVMGLYCGMKLGDSSVKPEESPTNFKPYVRERPAEFRAFKEGTKVRIVGDRYPSGGKIPNWVHEHVYTLGHVDMDTALIQEIRSVVWLKDLVMGDGSRPVAPETEDTAGKTAEPDAKPAVTDAKPAVTDAKPAVTDAKPAVTDARPSVKNAGIVVGSTVRVTGSTYATGQKIPNWVRNRKYTVSRVNGDMALLGEIVSWVRFADLQPEGAPVSETDKGGFAVDAHLAPDNSDSGTPSAGLTSYQRLLAEHPEIETNQDLINYFISEGGGDYGTGAACASQYGVSLNALCRNRGAAVSRDPEKARR